jgi:hypothetical protein
MKRIGIIILVIAAVGSAVAQSASTSPSLAVVKIVADPFSLMFNKASDLPVGSNWNGFVAVTFTPKVEERTLPNGSTGKVDVSELTLKRGDKTITLVKGRRVTYTEYIVHLVDRTDAKPYSVRTGSEMTVGSRTLRLRDVNVKKLSCTLIDVATGETYTITRIAQQASAGDSSPRATRVSEPPEK